MDIFNFFTKKAAIIPLDMEINSSIESTTQNSTVPILPEGGTITPLNQSMQSKIKSLDFQNPTSKVLKVYLPENMSTNVEEEMGLIVPWKPTQLNMAHADQDFDNYFAAGDVEGFNAFQESASAHFEGAENLPEYTNWLSRKTKLWLTTQNNSIQNQATTVHVTNNNSLTPTQIASPSASSVPIVAPILNTRTGAISTEANAGATAKVSSGSGLLKTIITIGAGLLAKKAIASGHLSNPFKTAQRYSNNGSDVKWSNNVQFTWPWKK